MEEYDLPIRLPKSISFANGRHIDYLYAASANPSEVHLINFNEYNREVWPYGDFFLTLHSK